MGSPCSPAVEAIITMRPNPASRITREASAATSAVPTTFVVMTVLRFSAVVR